MIPNAPHTASRVGSVGALFLLNIFVTVEWERLTLNTYTHLGLEDAVDELKRVEELENARKEMEKINGEGTVSQKMFRAI